MQQGVHKFMFEGIFMRMEEGEKFADEVREFKEDQALFSSWQKLKSIDADNYDCLLQGDFSMNNIMIRSPAVKVSKLFYFNGNIFK